MDTKQESENTVCQKSGRSKCSEVDDTFCKCPLKNLDWPETKKRPSQELEAGGIDYNIFKPKK